MPAAAAPITCSGGSLSASTVNLNAGGIFNQTGGSLNAATFNQQGGTVTGALENRGVFNYYQRRLSAGGS